MGGGFLVGIVWGGIGVSGWMVLFAAEDHVKLYCDGDLPTSTTLMMLMDAGSRNNGAPTSPGTDEAGPPTISRQRSQQ